MNIDNKPVIFLDYDGVLLTGKYSYGPPRRELGGRATDHPDPEAVAALNYLLAETGALIVVSSTHRWNRMRSEMQDQITSWGVQGTIIGMTPRMGHDGRNGRGDFIVVPKPRGVEIQKWIDTREYTGPFAIIDDDADMAHLMHRLIKTDFPEGLTVEHARRAADMIREQQEERGKAA